jgi:hypothetical protein
VPSCKTFREVASGTVVEFRISETLARDPSSHIYPPDRPQALSTMLAVSKGRRFDASARAFRTSLLRNPLSPPLEAVHEAITTQRSPNSIDKPNTSNPKIPYSLQVTIEQNSEVDIVGA